MSSLLIRGGHVLDFDRPFQAADVLIQDTRISQIGANLQVHADRVVDATDKVVMPGLVNAHTHSPQILERGLGDALQLDAWLVAAINAGPPPDPEALYTLAAWSALVQLKTGCTGCLDHVSGVAFERLDESYDAIMQAYTDTGFRAAVAMTMSDLDLFQTMPCHLVPELPVPRMDRNPPPASDLLLAGRRFLQRWQGKAHRLQAYLGPSAPQRCSDELLSGCFALAEEFDAGIHSHMLEARSQWFACETRFGMSPVAYLDERGWLSARLSCAHGVWLSQGDMRRLAAAGSIVVHNPVSNLRLASGVANIQQMLASGTSVALGADGAASNDNQNMWEVVKLAAILHRIYGERAEWLSAEVALRLCLQGGAAVLRQPIGSLRRGYEADLVVLGGADIFLRPKAQMINSLVLSELGQSVETVVVAGEVVLEEGRSTRVDEARLRHQANEIVQRSLEDPRIPSDRFAYVRRLLEAVDRTPGGPTPPLGS